jgi:putative acetyltransferase
MSGWIIRDERPGDEAAIAALTEVAFRSVRHSDGGESAIIARLRESGELALSLVVENRDQAIVGHVAFSRVTISDGTPGWFGLGPISVIPLRQGVGIGGAMASEGLARLRSLSAGGCVVLGDPRYYGPLGFRHDPALVFPGPPPQYFQRLVFSGAEPQGTVRYAAAFYG